MGNDELKQRLTAMFAEEALERTGALERDLLSLETSEAADRAELFKSLFRDAHSLKGGAGLVEIRSIESACHCMEELFGAARDGRLAVDHAAIELLLAVTDAIADAARRLSGGDPQPGRLGDLIPQLATMVSGSPALPAPPGDQDRMASLCDQQSEPEEPDADGPEDHSRKRAFVRVPAETLDALLSQSGELLVAGYRCRARMDQITALQELTKGPGVQRMGLNGRAAVRRKATSSVVCDAEVQQSRSFFKTGSGEEDLLLRLNNGLQQLGKDLVDDHRIIDKAAMALDSQLRQARMQPFSLACEGLDRLVRDLGQSLGKSIRLVMEGGEIGVDRSATERLRDVLRHLVRNAVDHGIEPVGERVAAGKEEVGRITIAAVISGDRVKVSVADDGRGLDVASIREQARTKGIVDMDEREIPRSIFLPNFSTSPKVTQVSGRGVGLDVVKNTVEDMRGAVDVAHLPGRGATFTLTLPLTLTTVRALLLSTGDQIFAIDTASVHRLIRCSKQEVQSIDGQPVILSSNGPMAVLELAEWLGLPVRASFRSTGKFPAIILNMAGRDVAILVEEVLAEQDLVVRGLGPRLSGIRRYTGGTILSDGRVALVLNPVMLAEGAIEQRSRKELASFVDESQPPARRRVLVADDSVTIRTLQKSILEAAGYEVTVATDGAEAWQILQRQGADIVVSDVDMPRMDGFDLTESIRGSKRFKGTPVVLLTARETEEDKARGLQLGADAYLLKSTFDQRQLLDAIAQLV